MHDPFEIAKASLSMREVLLWNIGRDIYKKYGVRIGYRVLHTSPDKSHRKYWLAAISLPGEENQVRLAGTSEEAEKRLLEPIVDPVAIQNFQGSLEIQGPVTYEGPAPFLGVLGIV
jgi:hypothetical protein